MNNKDYSNGDYRTPKAEPQYKLAHAYVPYQVMGKVYKPDKALCKGTLFPELYMPYKYEEKKENKMR